MSNALKWTLVLLGILTAILIVTQVVMALLILSGGSEAIRTAHQHSGYLMAVVSLLYVVGSLVVIASLPSRPKS